MADEQDADKSQDPSAKRLDEALERGDVAKSQEVSTWFVIAGGALILLAFSGPMSGGLQTSLRGLIANAHDLPVDGRGLLHMTGRLGFEVLAAIAIPFLLLALAALAGNMIQHRLVWSLQVLTPKLNKISPLAGLKRLFSKQALANFAKGLVKLALIGTVMTALLWPERSRLDTLVTIDPAAILPLTKNLALQNGDLGIAAVRSVIDGGGNQASGNGDPRQCTNIACS